MNGEEIGAAEAWIWIEILTFTSKVQDVAYIFKNEPIYRNRIECNLQILRKNFIMNTFL